MMDAAQPNALSAAIARPPGDSAGDVVNRALQAVRSHLGMNVAYISEFVDNRSVFRQVDAPGCEAKIKVGDSHSLDDVYCRKILDGRIPELMPDTAAVPEAASMPITAAAHIGAHMSVPVKLPDGRVYGMFCCLSFEADHSLNGRDLQMMKAFADIAAFEINRDLDAAKSQEEKRARVAGVLEKRQFSIVFQPIQCLESNRTSGMECLSRFTAEPTRSPDLWFKDAAESGLGPELEIAAARMALASLRQLPSDVYVSVNASPQTMMTDAFSDILTGLPPHRIVLEMTEHDCVADYENLCSILQPMRQRGFRLAIDDAGAGYSSLRHILDLQPDIIKLDIALTRNVNIDPARRALASALIRFARETQCEIVAEGVETAAELNTLRNLGVDKAQGYYIARPMPLPETLAWLAGRNGADRQVA